MINGEKSTGKVRLDSEQWHVATRKGLTPNNDTELRGTTGDKGLDNEPWREAGGGLPGFEQRHATTKNPKPNNDTGC